MKILLAVDGSEPSLTAVELVSAMSLPAGSIELMTVIADEPVTYGPWPASAPIRTPAQLDRTSSAARERLDETALGLTTDDRTTCTVVHHGRPASEIVMEAD